MAAKVSEKTNAVLSTIFSDEEGEPVNTAEFDVLFASIHDADNFANVLRSSDDLMTLPNVELTEDEDTLGLVRWYLQPFDTLLFDQSTTSADTERHVAYIRGAWASEDVRSSTNGIATVEDSPLVTVTLTAHGLAVRDAFYLKAAADVGGLDVGSVWIVEEVVNANTFKFRHHRAATATASGGGATLFGLRCKSAVAKIPFTVQRDDPV